MANDLYETLDVPKNASAEQIRKAYKRKALQTHPDRLPPGATLEDKAASEEMFRKVNNAYEVLNDTQNRRVYDLHGTWPPPEPGSVPLHRTNGQGRYRSPSNHHHHHHSSWSSPFASPFSRHSRDPFSFVFTDPFIMFDSIFGDTNAHHTSSQYYNHNNQAGPSRTADPFEGIGRMPSDFEHLFNHSLPSSTPGGFFAMPAMNFPFQEPTSFSDGPRRGWASDSFITATVNGVTQTIHKQRDWDGNEHVTRTYPDGREVRTVNGVEQPSSSRGYIPQHPGSAEVHHRAHPGSASQPHVAGSMAPGTAPPHTSQPYANPPAEPEYSRRHDRRHPETQPYNSGAAVDNGRKRWWRGSR